MAKSANNANNAFVVEVLESERGWGQTLDGYLVFSSEKKADTYINKECAGRGSVVPDYYIQYNKIGIKPASQKFFNRLKQVNHLAIDKLSEMAKA